MQLHEVADVGHRERAVVFSFAHLVRQSLRMRLERLGG